MSESSRTRRLARCRKGASALEFALLAPIFLLVTFGCFEVALVSWNAIILDEAADAGAEYMRQQRINRQSYSEAGLRQAICDVAQSATIRCEPDRLKIGVFYAGEPITNPINIPRLIENAPDPRNGSGGSYVIAVGYEWGVVLPSTELLMVTDGSRAQFQARTYVVPAERPYE